jgi:uncharacterized protein (DUF2147 family)
MKKILLNTALLIAVLFGIQSIAFAQADPVERIWLNQEKTGKVQIYRARDGKLYGKIMWLSEPNKNGAPKVDDKNPDPKKRATPIMNLIILKGFTKSEENIYEGGTIYDPKNGKTYSCKMTLKGRELDIRGFIGISLIGRTSVWTLAD